MGPLVILGPGTLGLSLARHAAERGLNVRLVGRDQSHAEAGIQKVLASWRQAVDLGLLDCENFNIRSSRIQASENIQKAITGTTILMEALPEDLATKADFWRGIAPFCPETLLPLTASSCLPASLIRQTAGLGPGLLNFHLFVPVHRHPIVELAVPNDTPDASFARAKGLAACLGLQLLMVRETIGLAASRMGLALGLEAMRLLQEGHASIEDLDALMTLGYGHPCGPLELSDRIGLDLRLAIAEHLHRSARNPAFAPPRILKEKVAKGELGRKSGRGFYAWKPDGTKE